MAIRKQKLELTWIGKEFRPKLEPRVLIEDPELSYHASHRVSEDDIFDNRLIFGDNLLALKALQQEFAGKIKCIYIDPPFNTGAVHEHYEDGLEHSLWLSMMWTRLWLLRELLAEDGCLFVQIDHREGERLKIILDEVFGEECFKNAIIVRRGTKNVQSQFETIDSLTTGHDVIYFYSKRASLRVRKLEALSGKLDPGKWDTFWRGTDRPTMRYKIFDKLPETGQWRWSERRAIAAIRNYEQYIDEYSEAMMLDEFYSLKLQQTGQKTDFLRANEDGVVQYYVPPRNYKILSDVWMDIRTAGRQTDFEHEKHEELLERIIRWTTERGDLVLDSFAGSGTTGAVAQKMGRRWIMVELGEHCHTHIIPRLKKVIDGDDPGGITESVNWKGGGGFRYFKLGPSLLERDRYGNWVISEEFNAAMLAEAMCKLEGFTYAPSDEVYWQHGYSTERDFIYVTTQTMTHEMLAQLSEEVGEHRSLLICCSAFRAKADAFPNLTLKKIPKAVMRKCEWGHDDYSLEVENLPKALPALEEQNEDVPVNPRRKFGKGKTAQATLFDVGDDQ